VQTYDMWSGCENNDTRVVTVHCGTVRNPVRMTQHPNKRVRVWGHMSGDGTFDADQIGVDKHGDYDS